MVNFFTWLPSVGQDLVLEVYVHRDFIEDEILKTKKGIQTTVSIDTGNISPEEGNGLREIPGIVKGSKNANMIIILP